MGCCHWIGSPQATGLVIPEPELDIHQIEWQHPFSHLPLQSLLKAFKSSDPTATLTKADYVQACASLQLKQPHQPCFHLLEQALMTSVGTLDRKKLLLCGILLSQGSFQDKLQAVLAFGGPRPWTATALSRVLHDLVHTSVHVLPQMLPLTYSHRQYLGKLGSLELLMVTSVLQTVSRYPLSSTEDLVSALENEPSLHKVCWSNGVRVLLLEEDVALAVHLQTRLSVPSKMPALVPSLSSSQRSRRSFAGELTADTLKFG